MKYAVLTGAYTIDSTNNIIRVTSTSTEDLTVASGTYYVLGDGSSDDLLKAVTDAIDTHTALTGTTSTLTQSVDPAVQPATVVFTLSATATLEWLTSQTTFDETKIGFVVNSTAASVHTGTINPSIYWVADQPHAEDNRGPFEMQTEQTVAVDGTSRTFNRGSMIERRSLAFDFVDPQRTLEDANSSPDTYNSFQSWLNVCRDGRRVKFYTSEISSGTTLEAIGSADDKGTFVLDEEAIASWIPERFSPGLELYGWPLGLRKHIT